MTKTRKQQEQQQQVIVDQEARFTEGQTVTISTDTGLTPATVVAIIKNVVGIMYKVEYAPSWGKGEKYFTVVTGQAVE
jgi:hypothetical protein